MDGRNYFCEIKKHCTLKTAISRLNTVTYKEKKFFQEQTLWIKAFSYELLFH